MAACITADRKVATADAAVFVEGWHNRHTARR
jgi:hypothetical protein